MSVSSTPAVSETVLTWLLAYLGAQRTHCSVQTVADCVLIWLSLLVCLADFTNCTPKQLGVNLALVQQVFAASKTFFRSYHQALSFNHAWPRSLQTSQLFPCGKDLQWLHCWPTKGTHVGEVALCVAIESHALKGSTVHHATVLRLL